MSDAARKRGEGSAIFFTNTDITFCRQPGGSNTPPVPKLSLLALKKGNFLHPKIRNKWTCNKK